MYQKPSDLRHNLSYQQVVLFEIKLEEEMLLFHAQICIMTLLPIFTSLCFFCFPVQRKTNYFYYLAEQWEWDEGLPQNREEKQNTFGAAVPLKAFNC